MKKEEEEFKYSCSTRVYIHGIFEDVINELESTVERLKNKGCTDFTIDSTLEDNYCGGCPSVMTLLMYNRPETEEEKKGRIAREERVKESKKLSTQKEAIKKEKRKKKRLNDSLKYLEKLGYNVLSPETNKSVFSEES